MAEFKNSKIFSINKELEKMEKYLYSGLSINNIPKNSPSFNKIRTILNIVGFQYLHDNYIVHLKEEVNKNIDSIIKLYQFNQAASSSIIRQLWKIESLLTSRIGQVKNSNNIWTKTFDNKIKIFEKMDISEKDIIVKSINKKCSIDDFFKGMIYAKSLRNQISHINCNVLLSIKIKKNDRIYLNDEYSFKLIDICEILDKISGEEKNIQDIFKKYKNIEIYLKK